MRKDCSCWKEVRLPHSAGRDPVRTLLPPNSRSTSEGRLPQEAGRLPFSKGSPDRSKLERAGKAPACAHAAGKEPIAHQNPAGLVSLYKLYAYDNMRMIVSCAMSGCDRQLNWNLVYSDTDSNSDSQRVKAVCGSRGLILAEGQCIGFVASAKHISCSNIAISRQRKADGFVCPTAVSLLSYKFRYCISPTCLSKNQVDGTFRPCNSIPVMLQLVRCR